MNFEIFGTALGIFAAVMLYLAAAWKLSFFVYGKGYGIVGFLIWAVGGVGVVLAVVVERVTTLGL